MGKTPSKALCPLVRDIKPNVACRYIGKLTILEFDLIDWFRSERRLCDYQTIADGMGWNVENARRYIRFMTQAGVLGSHRAERPVSVRYQSGAFMGRPGDTREYEHNYDVIVNLSGPTMKGLHMWHDALGEEWDWREYDRAPWVTVEGVPTGAAAPPSWYPRKESSVA